MSTLDRIYVAGHRGLVGSAVCRELERAGARGTIVRTRGELDLTRQEDVERFFARARPRAVVLAAAKVGGILANASRPAAFISENLQIETNVVLAAAATGIERLVFLGSSCIYPRECPQPMREEHLLTGPLEPTNAPYAVAKIAGIELCRALNRQEGTRYLSLMPTNLYGPRDDFDLETSHVVPAMIRKCHEAREDPAKRPVVLWGTGRPRRELLHVDDLSSAVRHVLELDDDAYDEALADGALLNVGSGEDLSVAELAEVISEVVGYGGEIAWDASKPDGAPRKLLDVSRIRALGWRARIPLSEGLASTYAWYLENVASEP
jgi:GDP-L-fucose synthase